MRIRIRLVNMVVPPVSQFGSVAAGHPDVVVQHLCLAGLGKEIVPSLNPNRFLEGLSRWLTRCG
jgi:hypothetical protein